ncbi:MAG: DNA-directed polymerase subunit [Schlesneria sp.]|nr:DNA-directed polymerase subunit [Schlesneria sp.]
MADPQTDQDDEPTKQAGAGEAIDSGKGRIFPCDECGADLEFSIGTQTMKCPYCGAVKTIEISETAEIVEHDFQAMLEELKTQRLEGKPDDETAESEHAIRCSSCGAEVIFQGTLTSSQCPYCANPLQRDKIHDAPTRIAVDGMLPFQIPERDAAEQLRNWVKSLWWAPNEFLKQGASGKFNGVYLPYYTFDSQTDTKYAGQRGDHYWVTVGEGKDQRREMRTSWSFRSGEFLRFFDDVLIVAASDQSRALIESLEPWPLEQCVPFTQQMLAGLFARTYDVTLDAGFSEARLRIESALTSDIRQRIGGDEQSITSQKVSYSGVTFKHLLLPVWLMAYRYQEKPYRVVINAVTGEVSGERPYSAFKIASAILFGITVAISIWFVVQSR